MQTLKSHREGHGNDASRWQGLSCICFLMTVLLTGCQDQETPPAGDPWPSDIGDGGWNGGGGGSSGTEKVDSDSSALDTEDTATGSDVGDDTDDTEGGACPVGVGDRNLELDDIYELPLWLIGQDTAFGDLFLSPGDRLFLFNDQKYCEIVTHDGVPNFAPESGSFCTLTPNMSLRGWTLHQGTHFVLDSQSRSIVSGFAADDERVTHALPKQLENPTGLTSDGAAFWVSDGAKNALWRIDPAGQEPTSRASQGIEPQSVSRAGEFLAVLHGSEAQVQTLEGEVCYTLGLPALLSGFSLDHGGQYAYGVARDSAVVYRFKL